MKPILVVFLTVVLDLLGFGLVIPLLPFYAQSHQASALEVTLLMACYSLAQFVVAPLWGQLSDRVGRRPVMLVSIGLTAVMLAGFASASSLWMLFLFRTLHGAMTANISTAQACMADLTTPENRAKGMGLIGAGFGIGFTLGPALGGQLADYGLSVPLWIAAGLSAINFLLALVWLPETRHAGSIRSERSINPAALWRAISAPVIGLCVALTFVQVFSFALMESTFTLFAEDRHHMGPADIGWLFGFVGIVSIVIQGGVIGRLVRRFGEGPLISIGLALLALGVTLLAVVPRGAGMLAVFGLMSLGQSLATPSLQSLISRSAAASEQGSVLGSSQSMSALARALGPAVGGLLFSRIGPSAPFLAAGGVLVLAVLLSVPATNRATSALH
jgi:DHA1 family tetracycline resistance protein-like MFS transporter